MGTLRTGRSLSRRLSLALGALLVLMAGMMNAAAAEGALAVVRETFLVLPDEDSFEGNVYAEVRNTGDAALQFTGGVFELFGRDGNSIASQALHYFDCNPEVLLPGEAGFLYSKIRVDNARDEGFIADYSLTLNAADRVTTAVERYPATAFFQTGLGEYDALAYAAAIVENKGEETLRDFFAAFALEDAEGRLLYVTSGTWASSGVVGHSSMEIRLKVDEAVLADWDKRGVVPASAEAIVFRTFPGE